MAARRALPFPLLRERSPGSGGLDEAVDHAAVHVSLTGREETIPSWAGYSADGDAKTLLIEKKMA